MCVRQGESNNNNSKSNSTNNKSFKITKHEVRRKAKPAINNNSTTTIDVKQRLYFIQVSLADKATSPPHFSLNFTPIFGVLRTNCFLMHGQWEERL